ncbi:MAG: tryptophan-rich sensory protein [Candidatus Pacebacteria bacterium]|nr:tryptophan-rich sensory protein [Candidatus Paceibacterota bacterium]
MKTYPEFYQSIDKPFFAPPEWMFGLAWGIIYPLIAIAFVYLAYLTWKKKVPVSLIAVFAVNLIANFLFTPIQLGLDALWPASVDILIVLGTLLYLEIRLFRYSKILFVLLLPYLLWGAFATVLQLTITFIN